MLSGAVAEAGGVNRCLTVRAVPVDAFWSIWLYNADGFLVPQPAAVPMRCRTGSTASFAPNARSKPPMPRRARAATAGSRRGCPGRTRAVETGVRVASRTNSQPGRPSATSRAIRSRAPGRRHARASPRRRPPAPSRAAGSRAGSRRRRTGTGRRSRRGRRSPRRSARAAARPDPAPSTSGARGAAARPRGARRRSARRPPRARPAPSLRTCGTSGAPNAAASSATATSSSVRAYAPGM